MVRDVKCCFAVLAAAAANLWQQAWYIGAALAAERRGCRRWFCGGSGWLYAGRRVGAAPRSTRPAASAFDTHPSRAICRRGRRLGRRSVSVRFPSSLTNTAGEIFAEQLLHRRHLTTAAFLLHGRIGASPDSRDPP
jgi:hypothetical protein